MQGNEDREQNLQRPAEAWHRSLIHLQSGVLRPDGELFHC